jgi:hypothetical protein
MTCEQRRQIHSAISEIRTAQEPMQRVAGPALTPTMCTDLAAKLGLEVTKIAEVGYLEVAKQRREVTTVHLCTALKISADNAFQMNASQETLPEIMSEPLSGPGPRDFVVPDAEEVLPASRHGPTASERQRRTTDSC